jgi:hypothetical protein
MIRRRTGLGVESVIVASSGGLPVPTKKARCCLKQHSQRVVATSAISCRQRPRASHQHRAGVLGLITKDHVRCSTVGSHACSKFSKRGYGMCRGCHCQQPLHMTNHMPPNAHHGNVTRTPRMRANLDGAASVAIALPSSQQAACHPSVIPWDGFTTHSIGIGVRPAMQ